MNKANRKLPFEGREGDRKSRVVYVPPNAEVMQHLAKTVCKALGGRRDAGYHVPEVVDGLGEYLNVVAQLTAKSLTKGNVNWLNRPTATKVRLEGEGRCP